MLVVRNERGDDFFVGSRGNNRILPAGQTATITDDEWGDVPVGLRGPGRLNPLSANIITADANKTKFDYYLVGTTREIRYMGFASQQALDTDEEWFIKRFAHTDFGSGEILISEVQTLPNVAWQDRDTLSWT